jgi:hypothetical protein
MRQKNGYIISWSVVIFIVTLACACPTIPREIIAMKEGVETVQSALTEMPVDEMMETAAAMATEMPVGDIAGTFEATMGYDLPVSPEDMAMTKEAGGTPFPGFFETKTPSDIPIVEDKN